MKLLDLRRLYPFEALAKISDFVAGLVQRVPKKPSEVKADLQNSTATQGDGLLLDFLKEPSAVEAKCFRYRTFRGSAIILRTPD